MVVVLGLRPAAAELLGVEPSRLAQVGDVEDRELRPLRAPVLVRILADAEQQVLADRVQVGGVAGDLQLAEHARPLRLREVERVERVDLAEGDDVARVADEADGVDALALPGPPTRPAWTRAPPAGRSVVRYDSVSAPLPHQAGLSVLTTRSTAVLQSDHWLSRKPETLPLPR